MDFGQGEQENVLRRVAVYATQSLPEVNIGADKWIFDNAMDCVAWMADQINENLQLVDANERWYEDLDTAAITNTSAQDSCQHIPRVSSADLQPTPSQDLDLLPSPAIHRSFTKEAEKATRTQRRRASVLDSSSSSEVAIPSTVRSPFASPTTSRVSEIVHGVDDDGRLILDDDDFEPNLPDDGNNGETDRDAGDACDKASRVESKTHQSDDDSDEFYFASPSRDKWQLNDDTYFRRCAGLIKTKFYGRKFTGKPVLAFATRMENALRKEKDFFTKADPYIDTWYLVRGMVRPVFDLEKFVEKYPNLDRDLNELRNLVRCRVFNDSCPLVKIRNSITLKRQAASVQPSPLNVKRRRTRLNKNERTKSE